MMIVLMKKIIMMIMTDSNNIVNNNVNGNYVLRNSSLYIFQFGCTYKF